MEKDKNSKNGEGRKRGTIKAGGGRKEGGGGGGEDEEGGRTRREEEEDEEDERRRTRDAGRKRERERERKRRKRTRNGMVKELKKRDGRRVFKYLVWGRVGSTI
ncbi:hypothetical protein N7540_005550 [Penicillium herquei]|nr:hypothetical protein N7540_005550 [Penicillium herquei]